MRSIYGEILFWLHVIFMFGWLALFLVPMSWWPERISFHFYLSLGIVAIQLIWGALIMPWTRKYRMACFLTTVMQVLRGFKVSDVRNFEHSFVKELFTRAGIGIPKMVVTILTLAILMSTTILYSYLH